MWRFNAASPNAKGRYAGFLRPLRKNKKTAILIVSPTLDSKAIRENWICHGEILNNSETKSATYSDFISTSPIEIFLVPSSKRAKK
jgi:hypothetical protein